MTLKIRAHLDSRLRYPRAVRVLAVLLLLACVAPGQGGRVLHAWTAPDDMPGVVTEAITADREALVLDGKARFRVTDDHTTVKLPKRSFSVAAWVRVDRPQPWGGIVSCLQDNGAKEGGWLLGVRDTRFCFAVASVGSDDGDGLLTYLSASRTFTPGGWHHVVGTYDGKVMRLWVDGELDGESAAQSGDILYPKKTWLDLGAYKDANEDFPLVGRLHSASIRTRALDRGGVRRLWSKRAKGWPEAKPPAVDAITAAELAAPIERGVRWLLKQQHPDGSWPAIERDYYVGQTALCLYTLLKCGLPKDHPAVAAALAYLRSHEYRRTYDLGVVLMAMAEMKGAVSEKEIRGLALQLVDLCGNGSQRRAARWGYPFGFSATGVENGDVGYEDISNTQYALLGLRAAWKAGVKVGKRVFWERVARALVDDQSAYGGFGYRHGATNHTSSLTSAGVCSLIIVRDILEDLRAGGAIRGRVRAAVNNGLMWFKDHWSVSENLNGGSSWYYYFMYGLERIGSYAHKDRIGGRDWHSLGARVILGRQGKGGAWGDGDMDTCFALLFLRRGSRASGLGPRMRAEDSVKKDAAFVIGSNGQSPLIAWVRRVGPDVRDALASTKGTLRWEVDGAAVDTVADVDREALFATDANLERPFVKNGGVKVQAVLDVAGEKAPFRSNVLDLWIDGVEEAWHREAVRDAARHLVPRQGVEAMSSSHRPVSRWSGAAPGNVVDGRHASPWRCVDSDESPWVSFRLPRSVRASVLKLCVEHAQDVDVTINGNKPFRVTLANDVRRKQTIVFKSRRIRSVRLDVRSRYGGAAFVGVREIELFAELLPEEAADVLLVADRR